MPRKTSLSSDASSHRPMKHSQFDHLAPGKTQLPIKSARGQVVVEYVQKRLFSTIQNSVRQRADQLARISPSPKIRMRTYRADLRVAVEAHSFASHRGE